jgi:hypothetical protein
LFSKHDDVGINAEPDDSSSPAIPAGAVNGLDEIAERQCPLLVIGFHATTISSEALRVLWGVDPTGDFVKPSVAASQKWARTRHPERSFANYFAALPGITGTSKRAMYSPQCRLPVFAHPACSNAAVHLPGGGTVIAFYDSRPSGLDGMLDVR